jgi:signal transduction histidine kinase
MNDTIITLETQLAQVTDDQERVDVLNALAWELRHDDTQRAIALSDEARQLAADKRYALSRYHQGLADSLRNLARLNRQLDRQEEALTFAVKALALYEDLDDLPGQADMYNVLCVLHTDSGNYADALDDGVKALKIGEHIHDSERKAQSLASIGLTYTALEELQAAQSCFFKSLSLYRELDNREGEAGALARIAGSCCDLGDYEQALVYGTQSLMLYKETDGPQGQAGVLNTLGRACTGLGEYKHALAHFDRCLSLALRIDDLSQQASCLSEMGRMYRQRGEVHSALAHFHRALTIVEGHDAKRQVFEIHRELAAICQETGDYEQGLVHYIQFHTVKEAVCNEQADRRLKNLRAIHEVEIARQQVVDDPARLNELRRVIEANEQLMAELDAFAGLVAHDLKSPLDAILGYAETIRDDLKDCASDEALNLTEEMLRFGYQAAHTIDNLLMLADVRGYNVTSQPLDMAAIVDSALQRLKPKIEDHHAEIVLPEQWPVAMGHAPWIEEVWAHYLNNALHYGGDPPCIEIGAAATATGYVRCWVRDNGPGLSPEAQAELFTDFAQLDPAQSKGYGLSIVKHIIEKLGGQVGVESDGGGCVFSFLLPSAP